MAKLLAPPWEVILEAVRGCNMNCHFCGLRGITRTRKPVQMDIALARAIALELRLWCPTVRVTFCQRGESTMHDNLPGLIAAVRRYLPKAQMLLMTNGYGLKKYGAEYAVQLFAAGLNLMGVDDYIEDGKMEEVVGRLSKAVRVDTYGDSDLQLWHKNSMGWKQKAVLMLPSIANDQAIERKMCNRAGAVDPHVGEKYGLVPLEKPMMKRCVNHLREMVIHVDGVVALCCHEWRRKGILGVFPGWGLRRVWNGKLHRAYATLLDANDRAFVPCDVCDFRGGFRLGLTPKVEPIPNARAVIRAAMKRFKNYEETREHGS